MPRPIINEDECSGCGICVDTCPDSVLELVDDKAEPVNEDDCTGCASCMEECPMGAIVEVEED
ncbi:MAG: 4Fe-4S binding protein [Coriobacteriia bacterium]|jgi:NAD-dependent dihydropyrimidine dehydrogenase PreA subunit|nr:4Fe-4S binding protein [Coriobacteriia bacterium]